MADEAPFIDETGDKPRQWEFSLTFGPGDAASLAEHDEFMSHAAHRDKEQGFFYPDPKTGEEIRVYCDSYEADDSNPSEKKRRYVLIEIRRPS